MTIDQFHWNLSIKNNRLKKCYKIFLDLTLISRISWAEEQRQEQKLNWKARVSSRLKDFCAILGIVPKSMTTFCSKTDQVNGWNWSWTCVGGLKPKNRNRRNNRTRFTFACFAHFLTVVAYENHLLIHFGIVVVVRKLISVQKFAMLAYEKESCSKIAAITVTENIRMAITPHSPKTECVCVFRVKRIGKEQVPRLCIP